MGEAKAIGRYIRVSPRKARVVAELIRQRPVDEAMNLLEYNPKRAAKFVKKVLSSAVANAEFNHHLDKSKLYVVAAYVDSGPILKRYRPRAMGRATLIRRRTSHITIIVGERGEE
jgi:large subunit ribosomal protein L22